jgi:hypothetical protein
MRLSPARGYLLAVGGLLLVQGAASLLVRAAGNDPHAATRLLSDPSHATIHLLWGIVLLAFLARGDQAAAVTTCLVFGVFYLGLLALGVVVHHPFGLQIDGPENAFHAVVGSLALLVWLWEVRRERARLNAPAGG